MAQANDYDRYAESFKDLQQPLQEFVELNTKTLQSFQQIKPEDWSKASKPEDLLGHQWEVAFANGRKVIDYMQQSFQIFENAMLKAKDNCKKQQQ
ncbi:MAG: phasin family protein [Gammaproteobacteria bacterium]|nr:phasin family protein [Gammaproteobacteria bacterium]